MVLLLPVAAKLPKTVIRTFWLLTASVFAGIAYVIRSVSPVETLDAAVVDVNSEKAAPAGRSVVANARKAGACPLPAHASTPAAEAAKLAPSVASAVSRYITDPCVSAPFSSEFNNAVTRFQKLG